MNRRRLLWVIAFLACCLVTNLLTRWVTRSSMRTDFHEALDFHRYRPAFESFLATHPLAHGENVNGERLPPDLVSLGIVNVYRNGRFVYFVLSPTSFLADDATSEFIRQLDWNGGAIEDIVSITKRSTLHIQHLSTAPGWYFWMHN